MDNPQIDENFQKYIIKQPPSKYSDLISKDYINHLTYILKHNLFPEFERFIRNKYLDMKQIITDYRLFNIACQYSGINIIKKLYTPERINLLDKDGDNPIMGACLSGRSLDIMRFLIECDAQLPDDWVWYFNVNMPINAFNYLININSKSIKNREKKINETIFLNIFKRIVIEVSPAKKVEQSQILYKIVKIMHNADLRIEDIIMSFLLFNFELTIYLANVVSKHTNETIFSIFNYYPTIFRLIENFFIHGCSIPIKSYEYTKKMLKYLSQYNVNFSIKNPQTKQNIFHILAQKKIKCAISTVGMELITLLYEVYGVPMNEVDKFGYTPMYYILSSYGKIRLLCYILYKTRHIDPILFNFLNSDRWLQYVNKSCRIYGNDKCGRKLCKQVRQLAFTTLRHNILQMLKYIQKKDIKNIKVQGMDAKEMQNFVSHKIFDINLLYEIYSYLYNISHKKIKTLSNKKIRFEYSKVRKFK
jgi:hypothetical protein